MSPASHHTRVAVPADGPGIAAIYGPVVRDTSISFEMTPPDGDEMAARVTATLPRFPWLVRTDGSTVLGYAYATTFRTRAAYAWTVEVAVYVHSRARRCGVGRALYTPLLQILRMGGQRAVIAGITLPNPESEAFHESFGFLPVARFPGVGFKQGRWHDVGFWQLDLRPDGEAPDPPVPWPEMAQRPEIVALLADA